GVLRRFKRRLRQLPAALRILIEVIESLGDAFGGNFSQLQGGKLRYVTPRRREQLPASAPEFGAGAVCGNNLGGTGGAVLEADETPTFSHRRVDAHVASIVQQVQLAVVENAAGERVQVKPLLESEPLDKRFELFPLRLAHDRVMQAQAHVGRLAGGKPGEPLDGQVDALSFVGPAGVEHDEGALRIRKAGKHLSLRLGAGRRSE